MATAIGMENAAPLDVGVAPWRNRVKGQRAGHTKSMGPYMRCANPTAGNAFGLVGMFDVNMGVINAGDSFTLDYDIIATVSGDPFNGRRFAGTGPSAANVNTLQMTPSPATVPEPGSIALMRLALAGLAATRRKKSQRQG